MAAMNLKFTTTPSADSGTYRLLELPPDLCKLIESTAEGDAGLVIKGQQNEDAVLCTRDKTYTLRSVVLSNSVLVVTPPRENATGEVDGDVVIRDTIHEVLELVPTLPKLQRLSGMLREQMYDEGHEEDGMPVEDDDGRPSKRRRITYDDARELLQASDLELARGLKDRRILLLEGELRPITRSYLTAILEFLLIALVSNSYSHQSAPVDGLVSTLEDDHEVKAEVIKQIMSWFGEVSGGQWKMDVDATVREVGLGILRAYKDDPIREDEFLIKWRTAVGDTFEGAVSLELLKGNYIANPALFGDSNVPLITYFPASELPTDPAGRFGDLFLTRPRWKADEISPFLADIVVDNKERDKLLLKYARAITDSEGIWYTARAKLM